MGGGGGRALLTLGSGLNFNPVLFLLFDSFSLDTFSLYCLKHLAIKVLTKRNKLNFSQESFQAFTQAK